MDFIEVHEKETNTKVLIPLNCIMSISQDLDDMSAFIETNISSDGTCFGISTTELYADVKFQILKLSQNID